MIKLLNLSKGKKRYGAYGKTFVEYYGMTKYEIDDNTKSITFKNIAKEINIVKNATLLKEIAKVYKHIDNKTKFNKLYADFYSNLDNILKK